MDFLEHLFTGYPWLAPILIFVARLSDVTLGTFRIILIGRGKPGAAGIVGFFESATWLLAISQVLAHLDHPLNFLAYAGGFGAGTWLGVVLEGRIAMGLVAVRVITRTDATELIEALKANQFGITSLAARGVQGRVRLLFTVVRRKQLDRLLETVREVAPKSFVSVSDVRAAEEGFIGPVRLRRRGLLGMLGVKK